MSRYQKGKTNLDFTEARDSEWQWHQLGHMQVCTSLQTDNHANTSPLSFFTGRMPFLPPSQQRHYSNLALPVLNRRQFQGRLISPITARNSPKSNFIWSRQRETTVLGLLIHEKHSQVVPRHPKPPREHHGQLTSWHRKHHIVQISTALDNGIVLCGVVKCAGMLCITTKSSQI